MSVKPRLFTSTIGRKLIVAVTGLFLILFLVVHVTGNLQLFSSDGGKAFNEYTKFMTTFTPIKIVSYALYASILVHAIWSLSLAIYNKRARGKGYKVKASNEVTTWASRNMPLLGTIILIFIVVHMSNFWFVYKFGEIPKVTYPEVGEVKDMYAVVVEAFSQWWYVALYVVSMVMLGFHLAHGFSSSFQTLGINHKRYTPVINVIGIAFSIIVPVLFAAMPVYIYFTN